MLAGVPQGPLVGQILGEVQAPATPTQLAEVLRNELVLYEAAERTSLRSTYRLGVFITIAKEKLAAIKRQRKGGKIVTFDTWMKNNKINVKRSYMSKILTVSRLCTKCPTLASCAVATKFIYEHRKDIDLLLNDAGFLNMFAI